MFDNFLAHGSILSVILMVYASDVMAESVRLINLDRIGLDTPFLLRHPVAELFMFGSIPTAIWPSIYIGLYDGWVAGIISWVVLQLGSAWATVALRIRGSALAHHFIVACIAYPIGYYLSIVSLLHR